MMCLETPNCTNPQCTNSQGAPCCTETITQNCANMDDTCAWQKV